MAEYGWARRPIDHKAGEDATEEVANAAGRRMARRGRGRGEQRKQPNGATEEDPEQKARGRATLPQPQPLGSTFKGPGRDR